MLASLASAGAASAAPVVDYVAGNPKCADVASGLKSLKFDPVPQGTTTSGPFTIKVRDRIVDWTSTEAVDVVIVKGGPNANVYRYPSPVTGDTGLHAPVNPNNGQFYGLSHVDFCRGGKPTPPPPPPGPCQPGGPTTKPDGTPCVAEPPKECAKASDMKADGTPCTPAPPKECEKADAMKADGTPCTPEPPKECVKASDMKADGSPCTPEGPKPPTRQDDPRTPVSVTVPSSTTVLGQRGVIGVRAAAAMQAPRRCVSRTFTQVVTGRGLRNVVLSVNGRVVGRMHGTSRRMTMKIDPRRFRGDVLRLTARATFVASARNRRARTLRVTALRCAQAPAIRFAG